WRAAARLRQRRAGRRRATALGEGGGAMLLGAGIFAAYSAGCIMPRPMAALAVADPDIVRVDFHSHTEASHDGRRGFTAERNRAWHRAAGFDVAYVTDHDAFGGAERGAAGNPRLAGGGTVLLSGVEAWSGGEHLNVLGATASDSAFIAPDHQIDDAAVERAVGAGRRDPVFIETVPGNLDALVTAERLERSMPGASVARVDAIELSDAAPRGFEQTDRDRARILHLADSLGIAVVAGSDNHGWGHTAAAWSLVRVPGWRALTPDALGRSIEARLLAADRRDAVQVVERSRLAPPRTRVELAFTAPAFAWQIFATLSPADRLGWLVWAWGAALLADAAGRLRARRRATIAAEEPEDDDDDSSRWMAA
ncbi:MAG TPA: hypothetical protein VFJ74_12865, partial [Gemmatimonadaceae bacterium]|nr:hypothetical protein [Gemmatimonadaceae bacterium]